MHVCEASQQQAIARDNTLGGVCWEICLLQAPPLLQSCAMVLQPLYVLDVAKTTTWQPK